MKTYLSRAIKIWYMKKFWTPSRFHRKYPRDYSLATIADFIDGSCNNNEGQNFYKGYPFVYYIEGNLIRCGIIIDGEIYYFSFDVIEDRCSIKELRKQLNGIIEKHKDDHTIIESK